MRPSDGRDCSVTRFTATPLPMDRPRTKVSFALPPAEGGKGFERHVLLGDHRALPGATAPASSWSFAYAFLPESMMESSVGSPVDLPYLRIDVCKRQQKHGLRCQECPTHTHPG